MSILHRNMQRRVHHASKATQVVREEARCSPELFHLEVPRSSAHTVPHDLGPG